jgi:hypothetical protein
LIFDKHFCANKQSHKQRGALRPLFIDSLKKTSDEKEVIKNAKGLITKTSNEKRGSPKKYKGVYHKDLR